MSKEAQKYLYGYGGAGFQLSVPSVNDRHYFHQHPSRGVLTISVISKQGREGKYLTILLYSNNHILVYNGRRVEDEIRLCSCVLKSKNNISDWLPLHEQSNCFAKTLSSLISALSTLLHASSSPLLLLKSFVFFCFSALSLLNI